MAEVTGGIFSGVNNLYTSTISMLPPFGQEFINFFLLSLVIVIYAVFIWKFYRFIAQRDLIKLNLNQYNQSAHPFFVKIIATIFYFIEYIIILPIVVFLWFLVFTVFLILLSKEGMDIATILIISATIIAAIRITAYYKEGLSRDVAKLLPFTLLAFFILDIGSFDFSRILVHLAQIPGFIKNIAYYLIFIIILEAILRFFTFVSALFGVEEVAEEN